MALVSNGAAPSEQGRLQAGKGRRIHVYGTGRAALKPRLEHEVAENGGHPVAAPTPSGCATRRRSPDNNPAALP